MAEIKKYVSLERLAKYDELIKAHLADADEVVLQSAKDYADGLADNYEAAGAVAAGVVEAKGYTDTEVAKANAAAATAKSAADTAATAASTADGKAVAAQEDVDNLATYVGTIPADEKYADIDNVVAYVNKKAEETLASAQGGSSETAASVKAALDTYKAQNDPKVEANTTAAANAQTTAENAQTAADAAQDYAEGVAANLTKEEEARIAADNAQVERIAELEGQIIGLSGAMHFKGIKDAVPADGTGYEQGDVIIVGNKEYVLNGNAFVEFGDVTAEAEAITELTGRMDTAEGKITILEGEMDAVEGAVATKAEKTYVDEQVQALQSVDTGLDNRLKAVESAVGDEGSVATAIATAKQEAIDAAALDATSKDEALETKITAAYKKYADDEDAKIETRVDALETASSSHALASDLTALDGRVTTAEGKVSTLEGKMTAVETKAGANETAIGNLQTAVNGKAAQSDLTTATDRITALETWHTNFVECSQEDINNLFA